MKKFNIGTKRKLYKEDLNLLVKKLDSWVIDKVKSEKFGIHWVYYKSHSVYVNYKNPKSGILDDELNEVFEGDVLLSIHDYKVTVRIDENGEYYGELICDDNHPCKNSRYDLNSGYEYYKHFEEYEKLQKLGLEE